MRIFAIGDIHGCCKTFKHLITEKLCIQKSDIVYCVGDYIDRGKDSRGVVDLILELRVKGYQIHTLRGNHEQMMMDSVQDDFLFEHWIRNGGRETLKSFGVRSYSKMNDEYKDFFTNTKFFILSGEYIFVHAGLNLKTNDPFEDKESMLWIRDFPIDHNKLSGRTIIHGHTPLEINYILNQELNGAVNIDGGCVYTKHKGLGNLVALNLTDKKFIYVNNLD